MALESPPSLLIDRPFFSTQRYVLGALYASYLFSPPHPQEPYEFSVIIPTLKLRRLKFWEVK